MRLTIYLLSFCFLVGCQTAVSKSANPKIESNAQVVSALGAVTEGLTNQDVSQKELKNLAIQVQKDPQAKSAVQSINQALNAQQMGVKYCPIDGQRFDASIDICPIHKVKLKYVE